MKAASFDSKLASISRLSTLGRTFLTNWHCIEHLLLLPNNVVICKRNFCSVIVLLSFQMNTASIHRCKAKTSHEDRDERYLSGDRDEEYTFKPGENRFCKVSACLWYLWVQLWIGKMSADLDCGRQMWNVHLCCASTKSATTFVNPTRELKWHPHFRQLQSHKGKSSCVLCSCVLWLILIFKKKKSNRYKSCYFLWR